MTKGLILKGIAGFYYVKTADDIIECKARGRFRKQKLIPMVGDHVEIDMLEDGTGYIANIDMRKNVFVRPFVSNIDELVIVSSVIEPDPDFLFIDKMIAIAEMQRVGITLCFNKVDLISDINYITDVYKNIGYNIIKCSAHNHFGIDVLREKLKSKVTAFAGFSGVGKSSILNLLNDNYHLKTGEVSKKLSRGKHTTRHSELLEYDENSYLVDTPGFSMLELPNIDPQMLQMYFRDFDDYTGKCKYNGCSHIGEFGCSVMDAVYNGKINQSRYDSYKSFYEQLKSNREW